MDLSIVNQPPTEAAFVQDPYSFYETAREAAGAMFFWADYQMPSVLSYTAVSAVLRDRRFGRTPPPGLGPEKPPHQADFWAVEDHSMLELEPPRHTRLRNLVLRAFTSRRIAALQPDIATLSHRLIDKFPDGPFDLLPVFATRLPITVIARLLGVPDKHADSLLDWSHAMVAMYQAGRTVQTERAAAAAARAFADFLRDYIAFRRTRPADDLITELIAAGEDGNRLSSDELISTCILLLNAGHEATVHTIGNGIKALLENGFGLDCLTPDRVDATVEEILRYDTPLHLFHRWSYEEVDLGRHRIGKNTKIALLLGAANRDPGRWDEATQFDPSRPVQTNASFGSGAHFCVGAPLARLELKTALPILFARLPGLVLAAPPRYAQTYHFRGLSGLPVRAD